MSKKIAPLLTAWMDGAAVDFIDIDAGRAELRALLALWRATKEHSHAEIDIGHPIDPDEEPGEAERRACPICRARTRLERVSYRPGRGRAK